MRSLPNLAPLASLMNYSLALAFSLHSPKKETCFLVDFLDLSAKIDDDRRAELSAVLLNVVLSICFDGGIIYGLVYCIS